MKGGARSGTSVTAKYTMENGNPVFCIPSSLENIKGKGTNELIQNGSKLVTSVEDILEFYPDIIFSKADIAIKDILLDIPQDLRTVYKSITDIPQGVNDIVHKTGLSIGEVNSKIMLLQLDDKIKELPGQRFIRSDDNG